MIQRLTYFSILLIFIWVCPVYALLTSAQVTIKVVDEEGLAIEGAKVGVGFSYNTGWGTNSTGRQGVSDADGKFSASGQGNGHVTYGADKEGYYNSHYVYDFQKLGPLGWEPKNPELIVVLRKIEKPVPMYVRNTKFSTIEIPAADKDIGFDLEKFDWVAPYGGGVYGDFIFHLKRRFVSWEDQDCNLTITFSNEFDGIKFIKEDLQYGSVFKLPKYAPESGYQQKLEFYIKAKNGKWESNVKRTDNYIFRIRSEEEDGKVVKAMYGKVRGSLDFSAINSQTAKIFFKYYLNPDYTRNLEFDPKHNLFSNLPMREQVREP